MKLTIIGSGRAAWAFASIWSAGGWPVDAVVTRGQPPRTFSEILGIGRRPLAPESFRESEVVLFAIADGAIPELYRTVGSAIPDGAIVFHASGSLSSELFDHAARFSLHPLRSLAPPGTSPLDFSGTLFTWEGAAATRGMAERIAEAAGGEFRAIETASKVLYHAAAVFGANFVAATLQEAADLMETAGVPAAERALENLAISAVRNWVGNVGSARFTGPIARGEIEVVRRHLDALGDHPAHDASYRALARILIGTLDSQEDGPDLSDLRSLLERGRQS